MYLRRITDDEYNLKVCRKNIIEFISHTFQSNKNKCSLDYTKNDIYLGSDDSNIIYVITDYSNIESLIEYNMRYNDIAEITSWPNFVDRYNSLINREQLARKLNTFLNNELLIPDITNYIINIAIELI